jgi:putative peptide zinc metalloprotease protein
VSVASTAGATADAAAGAGDPPPPRVPQLREELRLEAGPASRDGAPTWTLHDPVAGRLFRIGWREFEMLARWHLGDPATIVQRVARETPLTVAIEDIDELAKFLVRGDLVQATDAGGVARLVKQARATRKSLAMWAIKNYLFIRLPLARPDRFLAVAAQRLAWIYTPAFALATMLAGVAGAYLVSRQWDSFIGSFSYFFSLEGAVLAFLSVAIAKALHELGHGLTAKRYGCNIPSMGIAFMVMYPMLYTDTTSVWRLGDPRKRAAVAASGMAAELILACYALLAWSFLPEGPLRSLVFVWATSTWILSLAVNLSPFLRFDGYYLFSDLLDIPNLQERAFALARWWMRRTLFGIDDPQPEAWTPGLRRLLIGYAFGTWLYRFFLFVGIAVLVYFMFFKILGLLLFVVEIWWFLARPVVSEMFEWVRAGRRMTARAVVTFTACGLVLAVLAVPWRGTVAVPALIGAEQRTLVVAQAVGQLKELPVAVGDRVSAGEVLARFGSPDLDHRLAQAQREEASLRVQIQMAQQEPDGVARAQILRRELQRVSAEAFGLQDERDRLTVRAPFGGTVMELGEALVPGEWVRPGEPLLLLADPRHVTIDAYVGENDLSRLSADARAFLVLDDPGLARIPARVASIGETAMRALPDPELASIHGGRVATRQGPNGTLVPETPVYRIRLQPEGGAVPTTMMRGMAWIDAAPESILSQLWRLAVGLAIRESGF